MIPDFALSTHCNPSRNSSGLRGLSLYGETGNWGNPMGAIEISYGFRNDSEPSNPIISDVLQAIIRTNQRSQGYKFQSVPG